MFAALSSVVRFLVLDEHAAHADIALAVEHMGFGRRAVAPRTSDLLVIGFGARRQIGVEDVAHVGLVDAHAESDGGDHHRIGLGHEGVLVRLAHLLAHAGMIGERVDAGLHQQRGRILRALARQAIDDAALALMRLHEGEKLLLPPCFGKP